MPAELTTVADDEAVAHDGTEVLRLEGLAPGTAHELAGFDLRTLPDLGPRLATFATVNDVHFGETVCGLIEGSDTGPVFRAEPGDPPYPEVMNRATVAEIAEHDPDAVVVKGDLTSEGTEAEYAAFRACYEPAFGDRLHVVRGNHDAYHGATFAAVPTQEVELEGVRLAVLDTARPRLASGRLDADQLEWLDELCARSDRPVLVFGHHHVWGVDSDRRDPGYFGLHPDDSELLVELAARRPAFTAYFAGHTHRNRVRRFSLTGDLPWVEVACVKDYPGTWAEYRVHEQGVLQVHRRTSSPDALAWTEKTRHMFDGAYAEYALGDLSDRCFAIGYR